MSEQQVAGLLPSFSAIHPGDQAGKVWVVTILATIYVVLSALVRGFIKWGIYGADDYLLMIATVRSGLLFTYLAVSDCSLFEVYVSCTVRKHLFRTKPWPIKVQFHHYRE
jgi:hypothetical protein